MVSNKSDILATTASLDYNVAQSQADGDKGVECLTAFARKRVWKKN